MAKPTKHYGKWRIRWLDAEGRRRSESFATFSDAQRALVKYQSEADQVRAGLKAPEIPEHLFGELCDYWLDHRTARKKSPKDDRSIIERHLRPIFGNLRLRQITLERVDAFRRVKCPRERRGEEDANSLRGTGLVSVKSLHNILTVMVSMLNLAVDLGWLDRKPTIKKPKLLPAEFHYVRTMDDIEKFLEAALEEEPGVFELYATAVYTGMRAGELLGLRWSDVDLERRLITVQRSYATTTKTDEIRHVPVLDALLPILREWKALRLSTTYVFPNHAGNMNVASARVLQEVLQKVRGRAGIPYRFTFHSLRHTFASHFMMNGGDIYRLQRVLGHKSIIMTERYSHLAPDAFESDYGILGKPLPMLANRTSVAANVIPLSPPSRSTEPTGE